MLLTGKMKERILGLLVSKIGNRSNILDRMSLEGHVGHLAGRKDLHVAGVGQWKELLIALRKKNPGEFFSLVRGVTENSIGQRKEILTALYEEDPGDFISSIRAVTDRSLKFVPDDKTKVMIGAASQRIPGWLATERQLLNVISEESWKALFNTESIDNLLAEHVMEHLSLVEVHTALRLARIYLKKGGVFRIAVPDAFHPSRYYYNLVKPGGSETPYQHKLFFDYEMITRIAEDEHYNVRFLEYFDENGIFHKVKYTDDDGSIQRCSSNNCGLDVSDENIMGKFYATIPEHLRQQFYDLGITYTSLIVDLIK